jgi:hypothetical protein
MTLYAPTDVQSISVGDGCGTPHVEPADSTQDRMSIDCPQCELALTRIPSLGWSPNVETVKLTCDEIAQAERDEAAATKAGVKRMNQWAAGGDQSAALAALVAQNTALMEQIQALTAQLSGPTDVKPVKAAKAAAKTGA